MGDSVFHYTNIEGLIGILSSNTLFATHYRFLNDLNEGQVIRDILIPIFEAEFSEIAPALIEKKFLREDFYTEHGRQIHRSEAQRTFDTLIKVTDDITPFFLASFCKHDPSDRF